jgi:hypothetical protein
MLHERENNQETETFLKESGKKFSQDCVTAMKLMYQGIRLNGETCKELYGLHDRRLRDCRQGRPDMVKSAWKKDVNGKRLYVEYWIDVPTPPSKHEVIQRATKVIELLKNTGKQLSLL